MAPHTSASNLLAAAYPADITETAVKYPIPGYTPNSNRNYSFTSGSYGNSTWWNEDVDRDNVLDTEDINSNGVLNVGEDVNGNGVLDIEDANGNGVLDRSKFPDVAPNNDSVTRAFTGGTTSATSTQAFDGALSGTSGFIPMLPGMSKASPQRVARSLWYRTNNADSATTGNSSTAAFGYPTATPNNLFIYNTSYNSSTVAANGTFNRNQPAPLILPETVCINSTDGTIDRNCASGTLNLNLPANPLFPSGGTATQPASTFTVCGVTGNSRKYQAVEIGANDITTGACPSTLGDPRTAIVNFYTGLKALTTGQTVTFDTVSSTQFAVTAASNTKVNVLDLTAANFESLRNEDLNGNNEDINNNNIFDAGEDKNSNGVWDKLDAGEDKNSNGVLDKSKILTLKATSAFPDPTFLLRAPDADVTIDGLYVKLEGVDPNKVFWLFPRKGAKALTIGRTIVPESTQTATPKISEATQIANNSTTVLLGNFIGNMPATGGTVDDTTGLNFGETTDGKGISIRGARFLGFRAVSTKQATAAFDNKGAIGTDATAMITAMTTVNQPVVVPVLQIHAPLTTTIPTSTTAALPQPTDLLTKYQGGVNGRPNTTDGTGQWMQRVSAATTTVNIYFVAGNTPSRSYGPYTTSKTARNDSVQETIYTGETGGGLPNFVRLSENWTGNTADPRILEIAGGFIQNTRSVFATGPFSSTAPYSTLSTSGCQAQTYATRATCIDTSSDVQTWFTNPDAPNESLSNFSKYVQSIAGQSIPFFSAPRRLWGFDVGLLVQQPDLFAQRFSQAKPGYSEFFRESGKDDPWVKTMLCALQPAPSVLDAKTVNATADAINIGSEQRVGTKPPNYNTYALGSKDRPSDCDSLTASKVYNPTS